MEPPTKNLALTNILKESANAVTKVATIWRHDKAMMIVLLPKLSEAMPINMMVTTI